MKFQYKGRHRNTAVAGLLLAASLLFAACGDAGTSTPLPQPTAAATTAVASTTAAANANAGASGATNGANPANGTPGAGNGNGAPGGANRPNFSPPVNGTIESYDDTTKTLMIKAANGVSDKFDASNARITKPEKITSAELGQLAAGNGIVQVLGQKGSDGSYNATRLTVVDLAAFGGGNGPNGGNGGPNGGGRTNNGTPRANVTPGAGAGAGGGRPGNGGPNGIVVRGGTLSGNKLTGTDFAGEAIVVNLSDSTVIVKQTAGTVADLKAGQNVLVTSRPAQGNGPAMAMNIALELQ